MKKILILFVLLLNSMSALYGFTVDGISYETISSEEVKVIQGDYSGQLVLPSTVSYDGKEYVVTSIGDWAFLGCTGLTSVTIPNTVTSIGNLAFYNCSGLTSIRVESGNIQYDSRNDCNAIIETNTNTLIYGCQNTVIPNTVTSIGSNAFGFCSGLTEITIPNSVTSIGSHAFDGCSGLTSLNIPNSVTSIGSHAFDGCSGLTSLNIPNSVTSIEYEAFDGCSGLTSVSFHCKEIGDWFSGNSSIKTVVIGNEVETIRNHAFQRCTGLTSITFHCKEIGWSWFSGNSSIKTVVIGNSVTSIGSNAFSGCSGLTSIRVESGNTQYDSRNDCNAIIETNTNTLIYGCQNTVIPNTVTSIGNQAFYNCSGLTSITIPNSVTSIGNQAFYNCSGLTSITIPNSVTSIGNNAFSGCSGLTSINIPNSVTSIGSYAFRDCSGLTSVRVNMLDPLPISAETFSNRAKATLYVPKGCKAAYEAANYWKEFKMIVEVEVEITFADANVKTICLQNWDTNGDYELAFSEAAAVTDLGAVFRGNTDITSFNELQYFTGLTRIGYAAFSGCSSLTSITIPKSVTTIEEVDEMMTLSSIETLIPKFFFGCSSLTEIIVEEGNPVYDSRDNCNAIIVTSTNTLLCGCKNTVIPNSVNTIGKGAFYGCTNLTSVTIPNSVTSIERGAFLDCTGLTSLFISKSVRSIAGSGFVNTMDGFRRVTGAFDGCIGLAEIIVEEGNPVFDSRDNCNAIIVTSTNTLLRGCNNTIIPNSTTSIGTNAFSGCSGLTTVTIPSSVTSIGQYAFSGCSALTTVTLPSSVARVGEYAFSGCSALTTVITQMRNPPLIYNYYENYYYGYPANANTVFSNRANAVLYVRKGCKETYENASGWDFGEIIELTYATITISSAGVATYCPDGDLDFSEVEAFKAYIATAYDTQTHDVTMMRVYDVPAGTGLYLKGEAGTYTLPYTTSYSYYVNLLKGTLIPITLAQKEGNMTNFILSNGASGLGFYPLSKDGPFGADKAYLQVPTGTTYQGAKMLNLVFEESESTDIQEITADKGDDCYYSLTGVKVERPSKGIYIYKGKKVMIK